MKAEADTKKLKLIWPKQASKDTFFSCLCRILGRQTPPEKLGFKVNLRSTLGLLSFCEVYFTLSLLLDKSIWVGIHFCPHVGGKVSSRLARKSFQWKYAGKNVPVRVVVCCHFWNLVINFRCFWMKEIYLQQGCCSIELTQIPPCRNCQYCTIFCQFSQTSSEFIEFYAWMSPDQAGLGDGLKTLETMKTVISQWEASIEVTWPALTNQRPVFYLQSSIQTFLTNLVTTLQLTPKIKVLRQLYFSQ